MLQLLATASKAGSVWSKRRRNLLFITPSFLPALPVEYNSAAFSITSSRSMRQFSSSFSLRPAYMRTSIRQALSFQRQSYYLASSNYWSEKNLPHTCSLVQDSKKTKGWNDHFSKLFRNKGKLNFINIYILCYVHTREQKNTPIFHFSIAGSS